MTEGIKVKFSHVYGENNRVADSLDKKALGGDLNSGWLAEIPTDCRDLISLDMQAISLDL